MTNVPDDGQAGPADLRRDPDGWEFPFPFRRIEVDPDDQADWDSLLVEFGRDTKRQFPPTTDRALFRCLEVARANRARTVIVETRYIDIDYRSEYSTFYSRAFAKFNDSAQRVHFFTTEMSNEDVLALSDDQRAGYLGYIVLRPQVQASVGRTMLLPPKLIRHMVRTAVWEDVSLFGQSIRVKAVPFMQQDSRLGACAHVAMWMCHYSAHLSDHRVARRTIAEFSTAANPGLGVGRPLPSRGLTIQQMSDLLGRFGLPPLYYEISSLDDEDRPTDDEQPNTDRWLARRGDRDARATRVCCRYLNSGLPVMAIVSLREDDGSGMSPTDYEHGSAHAIVACGFRRVDGRVRIIAHDDRRGPYLEYDDTNDNEDPWAHEWCRWQQILAPLPEKLWLSGEAAERKGSQQLVSAARSAVNDHAVSPASKITKLFDLRHLSFRTYALPSKVFKNRIADRIHDETVVSAYRGARFPRYVWIVEAIERPARADDDGELQPECVWGEVVLDATSDERQPVVLATRVPGMITIERPDESEPNLPTDFAEATTTCGQYRP